MYKQHKYSILYIFCGILFITEASVTDTNTDVYMK